MTIMESNILYLTDKDLLKEHKGCWCCKERWHDTSTNRYSD